MRENESAEHTRPRVQVHTRETTHAAVATWLLCAADDRAIARKEWDEQRLTLLRCGSLFAAIRLPGDIVRAAAGAEEPAHVDAYLATALPRGGAIIADGYAARYYALVPASTGRWWHVPDTVCLGSGSYLGVPRPGIEGLDDVRSYWSVPMEGPGALCSPTEVQALMRYGQERNGADQRAAGRAVVQRVPLDIQPMRSAAEQACDVESPDSRDPEGTIATMRAYTEVLAPEVKLLATRAPAGGRTAMAALIGVEEGRRRLSARSSTSDLHRVARRAAMSVIALCTHYENLTRPSVK